MGVKVEVWMENYFIFGRVLKNSNNPSLPRKREFTTY